MKKIIIAIIIASIAKGLWAQKIQNRVLEPFDKIEAFGSFDIEIQYGNKEQVKLESSTINIDEIELKVEGRKLKISMVEKVLENQKQVKVLLTYNELREISVSGGAFIVGLNDIKGDKLEVIANSGANIDIKVNVNVIEVEVGQGATLAVNGNCKTQNVNTTMGGIYSAYNLKCNNTYAKATMGGIAKVVADSTAELSASMGGTLGYKGNPAKILMNKTFGGKIKQADNSEE